MYIPQEGTELAIISEAETALKTDKRVQQLTNRPADVFISERFISSWFDVAFESEWGNELMDSQQWAEKGGQKMKRMWGGREGGSTKRMTARQIVFLSAALSG